MQLTSPIILSDYVFILFDAHVAWREQTHATALIRLTRSNVTCSVNVRSEIENKKIISGNEILSALNIMLKIYEYLKKLPLVNYYIIKKYIYARACVWESPLSMQTWM